MPPDTLIWLVGTLSVAVMGGVSAVSVAVIRRGNGQLTKGDLAELRRDVALTRSEIAQLAVRFEGLSVRFEEIGRQLGEFNERLLYVERQR